MLITWQFVLSSHKKISIKFLQQEEKPKIKTESLLTSLDDIPTEFSPLLGELLAGFMQKAGIPLPQVCTAGEGDGDKLKKGTAKTKKASKKDLSPDKKAPAEPQAQTTATETLQDKESEALPDKVTLFQVQCPYSSNKWSLSICANNISSLFMHFPTKTIILTKFSYLFFLIERMYR